MKTTNNPNSTCPTCGRRLNAPYRRIVAGKIVEGCIDDAHTGHLPPTTNTAAWHDRPVAKRMRAEVKASFRKDGIAPMKPGHVCEASFGPD